MSEGLISDIGRLLLQVSLPGAGGGLALFLLGLRGGRYRNNRYVAKLCLEIAGAAVTASFLAKLVAYILNRQEFLSPIAFLVGLAWVSVVQWARAKVTTIVEAALKQKPPPKGERQ